MIQKGHKTLLKALSLAAQVGFCSCFNCATFYFGVDEWLDHTAR